MITSNLTTRLDEVSEVLFQVFKEYFPNETKESIFKQVQEANFEISLGYIVQDKLVAVYILKPEQDPLNILSGKGLRGDALAVLPDYRKQGIAKTFLKHIGKTYGYQYDYFWGTQALVINNIDFWKKYRTILKTDEKRVYSACSVVSLKTI